MPYATQKAFQAIYDVTDEEREAIIDRELQKKQELKNNLQARVSQGV